ncbi:MAG: hypothetical protein ACREQW_13990 [Candidatus Binatia bacterium]
MLDNQEAKAGADTAFEQLVGGFGGAEQEIPAIRWSPEKYLAAAALTDALVEVRDFAEHPGHKKQVAEDLEWIFSNASDSPFSFLELCTIFDLEPSYVRGIVLHWLRDNLDRMGKKQVATEQGETISEFVSRAVDRYSASLGFAAKRSLGRE